MKKIIALLCALIMLIVCCITTNAATLTSVTPDEEIAKDHGYSIYYELIDGWKTPMFYMDENWDFPNRISLTTNGRLDISEYKDGELAEFLGIEVFSVYCWTDHYSPEMLEYYHSVNPNCYEYTITTADFYKREDLENLFSEYDFIKQVYLSGSHDEVAIPETVPCDVNFDNNFDTMDYITVKRAYFGTYPEAQMYCNKGDLNNNLEIDAVDSALMKRAYFDLFAVEE